MSDTPCHSSALPSGPSKHPSVWTRMRGSAQGGYRRFRAQPGVVQCLWSLTLLTFVLIGVLAPINSRILTLPFLVLFLYMIFLYSVAKWMRLLDRFPRVNQFLDVYLLFAVYFYIVDVWVGIGLYFSPFPFIDPDLAAFAHTLHFSLIAVMNTVYAHPGLERFTWGIYNSLMYAIILTPLLLVAIGERRRFDRYLMALLIASVIGSVLYFIFPTTDPSSVYHDPHFQPDQLQKVPIVHDIHRDIYLPFHSLAVVGFPSFHVIWACLIAYAFWGRRYLFPVTLVWAVLLTLSTMGTGWHYLGDVLGGIAVSGIGQALAVRWESWCAGVYPVLPWKKVYTDAAVRSAGARPKNNLFNLVILFLLLVGLFILLFQTLFL